MWDSISRIDKPHKPAHHLSEVLLQYKKIVEGYDNTIKDLASSTEIIHYDREDKSYTQLLLEIRKCAD